VRGRQELDARSSIYTIPIWAERAALSNSAQIIMMGSRVIGRELVKTIAEAYLEQSFDEKGRSSGNVA
jgi:D-erythrulose 4-phosphate isomerase